MPRAKKQRGRPVKYELPDPVEMKPEELARIVLQAPPKDTWRFEEDSGMAKKDRPD